MTTVPGALGLTAVAAQAPLDAQRVACLMPRGHASVAEDDVSVPIREGVFLTTHGCLEPV